MQLPASFATHREQVENQLSTYLETAKGPDGPVPARLLETMKYAVLGGGKRARPLIAMACAKAVGGKPSSALPMGCAIEFIHAYSLVHDDMPCMDDDDMRRGKPSVHKAFGEDMAVLCGDALQTLAFSVLTETNEGVSAAQSLKLVRVLADASGAAGMVGGQVYDMAAASKKPSLEEVSVLHAMKTGALFRAACLGGAIAGGASEEDAKRMDRFGRLVGRAFQVIDDILDLEEAEGATETGDIHEDHVSLAVRLGIDEARAEAQTLTTEAVELAASFGAAGDDLRAFAQLLQDRTV